MTTPQQHAELAAQQSVTGALPERDTTKTAEQQGLFRKFDVRRVDGSDQLGGKHHGCRYYVLDVDHDPYAAAALGAYADACKESHPELARDLREKWGAADTIDTLRAQLAEAQAAQTINQYPPITTEVIYQHVQANQAHHFLRVSWKDGIDIEEPTRSVECLLHAYADAAREGWASPEEVQQMRAAIDAAKGEKNGA